MTEIWFYHLQRRTLEAVLPGLLERALQRGWRAVVQGASEERIAAFDEHLWTYSDESFLALEGGLYIDFDDRTVALLPGNMITVNRGVRHRTRPMGERSVNLTFERADARSEMLP